MSKNIIIHNGEYEDRLYGQVQLSDLAQEIVETPPFRKLEETRQAGTEMHRDSYSRFEHCLQVRHLLAKVCLHTGFELDHPTTLFLADGVGLNHDDGHGPFSHHFEHAYTRHTKYDGHFLHDVRGANLIAEIEHQVGGKTVKGIGAILSEYGIDPAEVIKIVLGQKKSPLKSLEKDAEFGADHLASALSDFFYNTTPGVQADIFQGWNIHPILQTLRLAVRPESDVALATAKPEDLIIATTNYEVARVISDMSRVHNKLIFSEVGIANQFASYMLFKLMFEHGYLGEETFASTEKEVEKKIAEAAKKNKKIARLYKLIFENELGTNPRSFQVRKVSDQTDQAPLSDQLQIKRTYGFGLAFVDPDSEKASYTHKDPDLFDARHNHPQLRGLIDHVRGNLQEVARIRGTYKVELAV